MRVAVFTLCLLGYGISAWAVAAPTPAEIAQALQQTPTAFLADVPAEQRERMLSDQIRARLHAVNQQSTRDWRALGSKAEWEAFRDVRLKALAASLGEPLTPQAPQDLPVVVGRTLAGEGFTIENVAYESRPGNWVTANLYAPQPARDAMPCIVIASSHHNSKTQGELQDMGMTWARLGCLVIVPDLVGYGERREHPFTKETDYAGSFRLGRQAYYFRYNTGLQLYLAGESLMGWNVWDLSRGLDVLLARKGSDPKRTAILGSVAGGGDPCAVAAAVDPRFQVSAPFNFGGAQPETRFPLPDDAEDSFGYAGGGSWESTRSLRLSARDGFLPWVIVGGAAPRRLIYSHEFSWDQPRDPVWKRFQKIYGEFYGQPGDLDYTHGFGTLKQSAPDASHCNNIGPPHRVRMHAALAKWWGIAARPEAEYSARRTSEELAAIDTAQAAKLKPVRVYDLAGQLGAARAARFEAPLAKLPLEQRKQAVRAAWSGLLGSVAPAAAPKAVAGEKSTAAGAVAVERVSLEVEAGIMVPLVLLRPTQAAKAPVTVAFAQHGKERLLKERSAEIADLLASGVAVCLPDLRGTGETRPGSGHGRTSWAADLSASEQMLGGTLLGGRVRDLRSVLVWLRTRSDLDAKRVALWGDSLAPANAPDFNLNIPLGVDDNAHLAEPLGATAALLTALFEDDVRGVYGRGGLAGYRSVFGTPFCYFPHDIVVPGALAAGDLTAVAATLGERPVALVELVNGLNRRVSMEQAKAAFPSATHLPADAQAVRWIKPLLGVK